MWLACLIASVIPLTPQAHLYEATRIPWKKIMTFFSVHCISTWCSPSFGWPVHTHPSLLWPTKVLLILHNLVPKSLPVSSVKHFLSIPAELEKHNECLFTLLFSTCTLFLGAQFYFDGTPFPFQSMCFKWDRCHPWASGSGARDWGWINLCSPSPWPQPFSAWSCDQKWANQSQMKFNSGPAVWAIGEAEFLVIELEVVKLWTCSG